MKQRLEFKCWKCEQPFSQLITFEGQPKLSLVCPYCSEDCSVDLAPYHDDIITVYRNDGQDNTNNQLGTEIKFPSIIDTVAIDAHSIDSVKE